jgi:hypothetical protein
MDKIKLKVINAMQDSDYTNMISENGAIYKLANISGRTSFYIGDGVTKISELFPVLLEEGSNIFYYEDHVSILSGTKYIDIKKDEFDKNFIKEDDIIKLYKNNKYVGYYLLNKIPIE